MSSTHAAAQNGRSAAQAAKRRKRREQERAAKARTPEPKDIVSGAGLPLDPGVRRELEEQLGQDLSRVRLHTDRDAGALTGLLGADAVAVGQDIFFREGAYAPGTAEGRRLLAHEVLHTVQNPHGLGALRAGRDPGAVSLPHEPIEREAEQTAQQTVRGEEPAPDIAPDQATPGWLRYATVDADRNRAELLDPVTLVDRLTNGVLRSLRGDPADLSGRVRVELSRMSPYMQELVLDRLEVRLLSSEYDRLLERLAEQEADPLPHDLEPADVPEPLPDALELIEYYREADAARPEWPEREEPAKKKDGQQAQDKEQEPGEEEERQPESAEATARGAAPAPPSSASSASPQGQRRAEESQSAGQSAESEAASEEQDAAGDKDEREERRTREEEQKQESEDKAKDGPSESVTPGKETEAEDQAATGDEERAQGEESDGPAEDELPLGLNPDALSETDIADPGSEGAQDAEPKKNSAWDVELKPDDFLPSSDLDVSGVPTADELTPGSSTEQQAPTFPAPPPTKADKVEEQREAETAQEDAEADVSDAAFPDEAAEQATRDLQDDRPLDQEIGPAPEDTPAPRTEGGARDTSPTTQDTTPEPTTPDPETAEPGSDTSAGGEGPAPQPTAEPSAPETVSTSVDQAKALGGAGTAGRTAAAVPGPRQPRPTAEATATAEPDGPTSGPTQPDTAEAPAADAPAPGTTPDAPADSAAPEPGPTPRRSDTSEPTEESDAPVGTRAAKAAPATAPGRGGGGGGGGAAARSKQRKKEGPAPDLSASDPESGLSTAAGMKPHQALAAMDGVNNSVNTSVGNEQQALADSPPTMDRPAGSPETLSGDPDAAPPGEYSDGDVSATDSPEAEDAEVEGAQAPEGELPGADFELSTGDKILAGATTIGAGIVNWGSNLVGAGDVIDTDALVQKVLDLPTEDEMMEQAQVGTAPGVGMAGETDGLTEQQGGELDSKSGQVEEEGRADSEQPLGEDQIYPDVPPETLTADVPEAGKEKSAASKSGGGPQIQGVPPEAVSEVAEHEEGPKIKSAFKKGQDDLATERGKKDTDFQDSQRKHEEDVRAEVDANTRSQADERERAKSEVVTDRENWRTEQDAELDDIGTKKGEKSKAVREDIDKEEKDTDDKVEQREKDDDEEIEKESTEASEEAETERDDAKDDSGNWVTKAFDAIKQWLEELKNTIVGIFERARQAVVDLITNFQETVTGWIEEVRDSIVEMFEEFVEAIVELGRELLAAIEEIADRIRDLIIGLIADAIAFINDLANELKEMLDDLLDQISQILTDILDALKAGLEMAVDAVKGVLKGAMDLAMGLLNALGEWMTIASDIIADPGGWLSGAASSAEDGARNHLVPEAQSAIKQWFNDKIQEILGIDKETFDLLISGGMTVEEIVEEAWAAIVPQLPLIIGELVITKVVAKLIPGAGWVMAIIDALKAAYETLSEILRAFGLVIDYLKAVKSGNAGRPFAKAVAAGIVALIEMVYNALVSGIGKYVGKVTDRLKGVAQGFKDKSPSNPDNDDRRDQGDEVNASQQQTDNANQNLNSQPQNNPPANNSQSTSTQNNTSTTNRTDDDSQKNKDNGKDKNSGSDNRKDKDSDTNRRDDDTRNKDKDRKKEEDKDKPRRKPSPAGRSHKRSKKTTKAALKRNRRAKKALGSKGKKSRTGRKLDNDARRMRRAYKNRRDQLRGQQQRRHEERRRQRDDRRKKENSPESKAARLRKIVARIQPRIERMLGEGIRGSALRAVLSAMRVRYRLTRLESGSGERFSIQAALNPQVQVTGALTVQERDLLDMLDEVSNEILHHPKTQEGMHQISEDTAQSTGKQKRFRVPEGVGLASVARFMREQGDQTLGYRQEDTEVHDIFDYESAAGGVTSALHASNRENDRTRAARDRRVYNAKNPADQTNRRHAENTLRIQRGFVHRLTSTGQKADGAVGLPYLGKEEKDGSWNPGISGGLLGNAAHASSLAGAVEDMAAGGRSSGQVGRDAAFLGTLMISKEAQREKRALISSGMILQMATQGSLVTGLDSGSDPKKVYGNLNVDKGSRFPLGEALNLLPMETQGAMNFTRRLAGQRERDKASGKDVSDKPFRGKNIQGQVNREILALQAWVKSLDIKTSSGGEIETLEQLREQVRAKMYTLYGLD
ncbi:DUF4157 domain-containing protein [Streptomyces sp. NPDC050428]|uniref:eCIS core domain-containing protein n=1 Tax=Streptomyces sp. NPDC050428 TaxID=3155757 RepID=UPI00343B115F